MKMRAVYEGVRHCPDNAEVEICTDSLRMDFLLKTTRAGEENGDIAARYRRYVADHGISVHYCVTEAYNGDDLPANDHDEWTWWARHLCDDAIGRFQQGKQNNFKKDANTDRAHDTFGEGVG